MGALSESAGVVVAEPVLGAGVFRTPFPLRNGYGPPALVLIWVRWIARRHRSGLPNYVVLARTAHELLIFAAGGRVDEIGPLRRRECLDAVRARRDPDDRFTVLLDANDARIGFFTCVTFDVETQSLVDFLLATPEARPRSD